MIRSVFIGSKLSISQPVKNNKVLSDSTNRLMQASNNYEKKSSSSSVLDLEVNTPLRKAVLLSPNALIQIGASPLSKKYLSMRKIDFTDGTKYANSKKISFKK